MSMRSPAKIVTRTYGGRHRPVAEMGHDLRVTTAQPKTSDLMGVVGNAGITAQTGVGVEHVINGITIPGGMIPMRAKLPSSVEPAKHDIDVPELPALSQVAQLAPGSSNLADAPGNGNVPPAPSEPGLGGSGVFDSPELAPDTDVTLVVYAWHNVQPGVLSWIFPTVRAALSAAYAMRNAVRWAIVRGRADAEDLDVARMTGDVLIENT